MQLENIIYFCTYTRNADEPAKLSPPFPTLDEARDEAASLKPSGYWGAIDRALERYNEEWGLICDVVVVEQF